MYFIHLTLDPFSSKYVNFGDFVFAQNMESPNAGDVPLSTVVSTTNPTSNNSSDKQTTTNYLDNEKDSADRLIPTGVIPTTGGQVRYPCVKSF